MITFNNIVERFQIFADNHFFIKTFSFGSPDDVDLSKFTTFPLMHLVYTGATYDAGTKTYNLEVYILDVPSDKNGKVSRQKEVVSDAEQCAEDIIADIKNGGNIFLFAQDYEVVNATTTPLEEETKNVLSGVLLDLSVSIPYEWDACNAPIDGVEPGGTEVTYARRGVLRMLTLDGATDVPSVRTIKVTNGTLTDDGDGVVTLDTGGVDTLAQLTDVQIIDPEQGDVLSYNAGVQKWMVNGGLQQLLAKFKASASGAQMFDTLNDTTKGYIDLLATSATMKVNVTGIEISEASPGVLTFSVAAGTEGNEVEFDAMVITGSNSLTTAADVVFKQGALTYFENSTGRIWLRVPNAGNLTVILPSSSGTLALTSQALPVGGTTGQALIKSSGTDYDVEWADITVDVQYHDRYQSDAASFRSGATATTEIYYSAIADGDGYAQSASTDTPTTGYDIRRKLYYSEAGFADPDTGTWTQFADIADNTTFANAKTALLAYLKARTGGTVPISLKMTWEEVAQAPSFTGLLNESYGSGAAAAYSVRRLNGNYTGAAIQVERSSDNTYQDIGFDSNGDLDESALSAFCSGTVCKVRTWYGQEASGGTGSGNDAQQTDHTKQPTIYTGGAIVKENGRVAVEFDGTNDVLTLSSVTYGTGFIVYKNDAITGLLNTVLGGNGAQHTVAGALDNFISDGTNITSGNTEDIVFTHLSTGITGSTSYIYSDGVQEGTGSTSNFAITKIGVRSDLEGDNRFYMDGKVQESIIYASDKSTDRTSIESNIGGYFTQNTPLLDTYTGAAAAYSLRKLRTAYSGSAIRVRRASDNTEQDIGFNVFGELDTVSLAAFCGSSDGFVKTWYCQSGNANDATQTTTANQPKIYDSVTGVVTQDGKPALEMLRASQRSMSATGFAIVDGTGDFSAFAVYEESSTDSSNSGIYFGPTSHQMRTSGDLYGSYYYNSGAYSGGLNSGTTSTDVIQLVSSHADGTNYKIFTNGANEVSSTLLGTPDNPTDGVILGNTSGLNRGLEGHLFEVILYASDESTNRTNIESNINTFYSIY